MICDSILPEWRNGRSGKPKICGDSALGGESLLDINLILPYLYIPLRNQDHALRLGSIGLFPALAAVIYLARHAGWRGLQPICRLAVLLRVDRQ